MNSKYEKKKKHGFEDFYEDVTNRLLPIKRK